MYPSTAMYAPMVTMVSSALSHATHTVNSTTRLICPMEQSSQVRHVSSLIAHSIPDNITVPHTTKLPPAKKVEKPRQLSEEEIKFEAQNRHFLTPDEDGDM